MLRAFAVDVFNGNATLKVLSSATGMGCQLKGPRTEPAVLPRSFLRTELPQTSSAGRSDQAKSLLIARF
jgi:hypothetical protein